MLVLDTHVLVWLDQGADFLGEKAQAVIETAYRSEAIGFSTISLWEIGRLIETGRVTFAGDLGQWRVSLLNTGFIEVAADGRIAMAASELKDFSGDAVDRIIAATAMTENAQLMTADKQLLAFEGVDTLSGLE